MKARTGRGPRRNVGLSTIETLVCTAISAILLSLAVSPMRTAIERQRVTNVRAELASAIQWARWEAVRRNGTVSLQRRVDCAAALASADQWHCGWQMVAGDIADPRSPAPDDAVLQSFDLPQDLRLIHSGGGQLLQFTRAGYPTLVAHKFIIGPVATGRDTVDAGRASTLCMNRTGRVRFVEGQTTC